MGSATRSCLRNAGKLGTTKETENSRIRDPGEIWITLLANIVKIKATVLGTVNEQIETSSKRMQRHSGILNSISLPTSSLVEETKNYW